MLTLDGTLEPDSHALLQSEFDHALAEVPTAVVCSADAVTHADQSVPGWFVAMARQAAEWPGIPSLLACAGSHAVATQMRQVAGNGPTVFPTVVQALEDVTSRRPRVEARFPLPPRPEVVKHARDIVETACLEWDAIEYAWSATLVASELITNAILHTATPAELICSYEPGRFRLSVRDALDQPPTRLEPTSETEHGRGLLLVHQLTHSWGTLPTSDGGKLIWCLLAPDGDPSPASSPPGPRSRCVEGTPWVEGIDRHGRV
ncbi:MAG: ATP-binding protein [Actinomycetes bacterium]